MTLAEQYGFGDQPQSHLLAELTAELDSAVLRAYGSSEVLHVVERLEALNQQIAADPMHARGPGCSSAEARRSDYRLRPTDGPTSVTSAVLDLWEATPS